MMTVSKLLNSYDTIIFDFDGIIVNSGDLKVSCMKRALSDFNKELVIDFAEEFKKNFGNSRRFHFELFYKKYLQRADDFDTFFDIYSSRYADQLNLLYPSVPLCDGSAECIESLAMQNKKLYIVTGTITEEANIVLNNKKLSPYFITVIGSPAEKQKSVSTICQQQANNRIILIGDAVHDQFCAQSNQVDFLFVEKYSFANSDIMGKAAASDFYISNTLKPDSQTTRYKAHLTHPL